MKFKFKEKIKKVIMAFTALSVVSTTAIALTAPAGAATYFTNYTPKIKYDSNKNIDYCYFTKGSSTVKLSAGKYFVNGYSTCSSHSTSPELSGATCGCYDGAYQCYGFAAFMYDGVFGKKLSSSYTYEFGWGTIDNDYLFGTENNLKRFAMDVPIGTHIRVRTANNNQHSLILAGRTATTITVYDANGGGSNSSLLESGSSNYTNHCQINKQTFTYANFAKRYPRIDFINKGV